MRKRRDCEGDRGSGVHTHLRNCETFWRRACKWAGLLLTSRGPSGGSPRRRRSSSFLRPSAAVPPQPYNTLFHSSSKTCAHTAHDTRNTRTTHNALSTADIRVTEAKLCQHLLDGVVRVAAVAKVDEAVEQHVDQPLRLAVADCAPHGMSARPPEARGTSQQAAQEKKGNRGEEGTQKEGQVGVV